MEAKSLVEIAALQLLSETKRLKKDGDADILAVITMVLALIEEEKEELMPIDGDEILEQFTYDEFRAKFGLDRGAFDLLNVLFHRTSASVSHGNSEEVSPVNLTRSLLITLWYLASQESIAGIAFRFDIPEATLLACLRKIFFWLNNLVKKIFLRWPRGTRALSVIENFKKLANLPNILGALGCLHVRIKNQPDDHSYFKDEASKYSIILQVVTLPNLMFSDMFCGPLGCSNDEYVYEISPVREILETNPQFLLPDDCKIVANNFYVNRSCLAIPYVDRGYLTRDQKAFNKRHDKIYSVALKSLEMLSKRFPRLQSVDIKNADSICDVAISCCVLFNICCLTEDEVGSAIENCTFIE